MTGRLVAYVDSAMEQLAFLMSRFGSQGTWSVTEQRMATDAGGITVERTRVMTSGGSVEVEFRDARPRLTLGDGIDDRDRAEVLGEVMERASRFAAENPPHHPGSLPRFPIPIEHYERAVAVPLPVLAVDERGNRGLFAPPRMAVVSWASTEPVGVREFDDFDPNDWPPSRLGDWPAPSVAEVSPDVIEACIHRFSACWSRVIDAWFDHDERNGEPVASDIQDALRLRALLDVPAMDSVYRSMNPRFAKWLEQNGTDKGSVPSG